MTTSTNTALHRDSLRAFFFTVCVIALPIMLGHLAEAFINMLDTIMVGTLGAVPIASVGICNQIYFFLSLVQFGICSGGSVFIAQFWGKKDICGIQKTFCLMTLISFVASSLIMLWILIAPLSLLSLFTRDKDLLDCSLSYIRIVCLSYPITALSFCLIMTLRSTEHLGLCTLVTVLSLVINAMLNYIFIFGIFGFRKMGVSGAALATLVSRIIEMCVLYFVCIVRKYECITNVKSYLKIDRFFVYRYIKIALPVVCSESLWSFGICLQSAIFSHAGISYIASYNIVNTVGQLTWVFFIGVGNAASIIIGKSIGESGRKKAYMLARRFAIFMPISAIFVGALLLPLSTILPFIFHVEATIIEQAKYMLYVLALFYPLSSFNMCVVVGVCRSGGDTMFAAIIDNAFMYLIALPLSFAVAFIFHSEAYLVFLALQIEQVLKAFAGFFRLKSGKWLLEIT